MLRVPDPFARGLLGPALLLFLCLGACGGGGSSVAPPPPDPPPAPQVLSFVNWEVPPVHALERDPSGTRLFLAHEPDHRLEVYDLTTGLPFPLASIPVGLCPVSVRHRAGDEVWVVNHVSDTVSVVDVALGCVVATLPTLDEPCDVVFAGTPPRAFVSCSQANAVQVFDPADLGAPPLTVALDAEDPRALAVSPDGQTVHVAVFESGNATTILGGGIDEVGLTPLGPALGFFPPNVVNDPATPYGGVNPPPNAGLGFDPPLAPGLPPPPPVGHIVRKDAAGAWRDDQGVDWTAFVSGPEAARSGRPVGWDLPDRDLLHIDAGTLAVSDRRGLMNLCMALAVNPASGEVLVVGTDARNEQRFEPRVSGRFLRVLLARAPAAGPAAVLDLNPHLDYQTARVPRETRNLSLGDPRAIAVEADGSHAWIAGMGSDNLVRVTAAGARAGLPIAVGRGPAAIALDEARGQAYLWNRFEGSLSVVDLVLNAEVARVPLFDPTPPAIQAGRRALYDTHATSGLGHVACASCHVDARMDRLAWDLGDPSGAMAPAGHLNCSLVGALIPCPDFHPMKGPMTTQTLQDIVGHEPLHWRGDRDGLEAFNPAFVGLQGADAPLDPAEMQAFEDFLASLHHPPNPFRNLDNSLPTSLALPGHFSPGRFGPAGQPLPDGDAVRGLALYREGFLDGSTPGLQVQCVTCHTLPTGLGTDHRFRLNLLAPAASGYDPEPLPPGPLGERHLMLVSVDGSTNVSMKVPQLANLYEKTGFDLTQTENRAGFGFLHDGSVDSLARFVAEPVFDLDSDQDVADLVAFMLAFSGGDLPAGTPVGPFEPPGPPGRHTHAGVGAQLTLGAGAEPPRLAQMRALAEAGAVDLVVHGVVLGEPRGWVLDRVQGLFLSDRDAEAPLTAAALRALATPATPFTWLLVPEGLGVRLGIDRDEDGFGDRTELDQGSDPLRQSSVPGAP